MGRYVGVKIGIVTVASLMIAVYAAAARPVKPLTAEQRAELASRRAAAIAAEGGVVDVGGKGKVVVFVQKGAPRDAIADESGKFGRMVRVPVEVLDGGFSMSGVASALETVGATAAVFFGDNPSLPLSLVAMEERWAFVNLARLSADGPDGAALAMRSRKMLMRNLLLLLGAAGSKYPANPIKPVATIKDLDSLPEPLLTIDSLMGMSSYLPGLGIERYETMTYREACEEGVAPPPTNDMQRAIWSKYNKK